MDIPKREPYYSLDNNHYLPKYIYKIKNIEELLYYIDNNLYKKNYTNDQYNMIKFSILILYQQYPNEDIIKLVNSLSINFDKNLTNLQSGNTIYNLNFDNEYKIKYPAQINIRTIDRNIIHCQATILHEIRHVLTSLHNISYKINDEYYYTRRGLCIFRINKYHKGSCVGNNVDEVYNVHFTNYNMTNLLSLKRVLKDNYLGNLKCSQPSGLYRGNSYSTLVDTLYPILLCNELSKIANESAYNGHIENYYEAFNNIFEDIIECHDFMSKFDKKIVTYDDKKLVKKLYEVYKKRV